MRILLVQPASFENGRIGLENALWMSEPAALTAIAAMVRDRHEVRILDMRLEEPDALPRLLAEFRPALVGITCMTTDAFQAQAVAYCARSVLGDDVFTVVGGHHPTLAPEFHVDTADAVCVGEGEETFLELVEHLESGGARDDLSAIDGLAWRRSGDLVQSERRSQARALESFPSPARDLLGDYLGRYFFGPALGMASIQTSRGCAFNCNFCAIWEFYERKVRFLDARAIVDQMEAVPEKFVMFLDDNFLSHRPRIEEMLDEIERRGIKKYWMIQGRSDFIAENPDLMKRMRDAGLGMVLSGYETNDESTLDELEKDNTRENNLRAAKLLDDLGVLTTGIFMTRPDFRAEDFDRLYASINEMRVTVPLVVIHTPLPGTVAWRQRRGDLLTEDVRLFDLLHAVVPTRLPRAEFYRHYARWNGETMKSTRTGLMRLARRPGFGAALLKGLPLFSRRLKVLRKALEDPLTYSRDEAEIIVDDDGRRESPGVAEMEAVA